MDLFNSIIQTVHRLHAQYPTIFDAIRLFCAGVLIETIRRWSTLVIYRVHKALTLTIRIQGHDEAYDWVHYYLSLNAQSPNPNESSPNASNPPRSTQRFSIISALLESIWPSGSIPPRDVRLATRKPAYYPWRSALFEDVNDPYLKRIRIDLTPYFGVSQGVRYEGRLLWFTFTKTEKAFDVDDVWIEISAFAAPYSLIESFTNHARQLYLLQNIGKLSIYHPRTGGHHFEGSWKRAASKPARPWESVILPGDVKDGLLADCEEFLHSEGFYRDRGLPYRRGYLLWGKPGSGKSSLIAALAARLKLDIYMINLGARGLDDSMLQTLLSDCPSRCIFLIEDVDCAIKIREEDIDDDADDKDDDAKGKEKKKKKKSQPKSEVTLSGLLNALDGVASSEGRLLFCTTNHIEKIDPALSRPGRCDVWLEFGYATKDQAEKVFNQFYTPHYTLNPDPVGTPTETKSTSPIQAHDIRALAKEFAKMLKEDSVTVSVIQGYLMRYKKDPRKAIDGLEVWTQGGFKQETVAAVKDAEGSWLIEGSPVLVDAKNCAKA